MNRPPSSMPVIHYPESDGKPMADNTVQFWWITVLAGNLAALFSDRPDVFVSGNQFWYPVENFPQIVQAPDTYVVFGRPKGERPSYKQWEEDNVPMTVVFEVRSPNDSDTLMREKLEFYDEHGVEEYYLFDPEANTLSVYLRRGGNLGPARLRGGLFTSPRLGIRFDLADKEMAIYYPNGDRFLTFVELRERQQRDAQRADEASQRADEAERRLMRLAELSRKARRGQTSAEELAELEQLEDELS